MKCTPSNKLTVQAVGDEAQPQTTKLHHEKI